MSIEHTTDAVSLPILIDCEEPHIAKEFRGECSYWDAWGTETTWALVVMGALIVGGVVSIASRYRRARTHKHTHTHAHNKQ